MALKVYADRWSQPARAVLIFCKANGIEFEEVTVDLFNSEHKSPEFKEVNPMKQVPAIVHGSVSLFESHAILSYLACAFPEVPDHWYPADLFDRAKINSILDWHHSNLRRGAAPLVFRTVILPASGRTMSLEEAKKYEKILDSSLSVIESLWLQGDAEFLLGNSKPSIADLSLACEVAQLEYLDAKHRERILEPHRKIIQWVENVKKATRPHFDEIQENINKVTARLDLIKAKYSSNL